MRAFVRLPKKKKKSGMGGQGVSEEESGGDCEREKEGGDLCV